VNNPDPGVTGRRGSCPTSADSMARPVGEDNAVTAWLKTFGSVQPFAVTIADTQLILGGKARSEIYKAIGRGDLDALKDGSKTLIVVASIVRYCGRMRPAQIKPMLAKNTARRSTKLSAKPSEASGRLKHQQEVA
jgi:hypothetical protein